MTAAEYERYVTHIYNFSQVAFMETKHVRTLVTVIAVA